MIYEALLKQFHREIYADLGYGVSKLYMNGVLDQAGLSPDMWLSLEGEETMEDLVSRAKMIHRRFFEQTLVFDFMDPDYPTLPFMEWAKGYIDYFSSVAEDRINNLPRQSLAPEISMNFQTLIAWKIPNLDGYRSYLDVPCNVIAISPTPAAIDTIRRAMSDSLSKSYRGNYRSNTVMWDIKNKRIIK